MRGRIAANRSQAANSDQIHEGLQRHGGSEMARNGCGTHEKRLYNPLTPATDVGQPLMTSGRVEGGLRWPSVVVSEHGSERAP